MIRNKIWATANLTTVTMPTVFFVWSILFFSVNLFAAKSEKVISSTPGYIVASELPIGYQSVADSIYIKIYDAMEGSKTYTSAEEQLKGVVNFLHIESRKSTIIRRLLFKKGGAITRDLLLETERNLRREEFLADAVIEIDTSRSEGAWIVVHTFDQWTTTLGFNAGRKGGFFNYSVALIESNVLGSGQQVGMGYDHNIDRDLYWGKYQNQSFLVDKQKLSMIGGKSTDGYTMDFNLSIPLLSKTQKWSYIWANSILKSNKYYYLDANHPEEIAAFSGIIPASLLPLDPYKPHILIRYYGMVDLSSSFALTYSFGKRYKLNSSWVTEISESYQDSKNTRLIGGYSINPGDFGYALDMRKDVRTGAIFSFSDNRYKTLTNFRNLKWQEDVDVGYKFSQGIYLNLPALQSTRAGMRLTHSAKWVEVWKNSHIMSTSVTSSYDVIDGLEIIDGNAEHLLEYQWKPLPFLATAYSHQWTSLFAQEKSAQLLLGDEEGFNGFPNRFFAGKERVFFNLEERYFPPFEFGTIVPALAVFINAGNTYTNPSETDLSDMHYSAGLGLRLGASRSTQKVVNHLNFAVPLDEKYRKNLGWQFTLRATKNL